MSDDSVRKFPYLGGDGGGDGGENMLSSQLDDNTSCGQDLLLPRPQNETLLPRKRSQATKSPIPPEALSASAAMMAMMTNNDEDYAEDTKSLATAAVMGGGLSERESPAAIRRDLRATPHEMKTKIANNDLSQLIHTSYLDHDEDEGEGESNSSSSEGGTSFVGARASLNASFEAAAAATMPNQQQSSSAAVDNNLVGARSSLNASFEAAAAMPPPTALATQLSNVAATGMKLTPRYTSPKRRKQSFDFDNQQIQQPGELPIKAQSFTPLRPPQTQQKRQRNKQSDGLLFSPKPTYSDEKKNEVGSGRLPPRPSSSGSAGIAFGGSAFGAVNAASSNMGTVPAAGALGSHAAAPSSPLTPSPKDALQHTNLLASNSFGSSNTSNSQSPGGTPFRFHSFPASLPRVNPRAAAGVGSALAPFRLNESYNNETGVSNNLAAGMGSGAMLSLRPSLRPKPEAAAAAAASGAMATGAAGCGGNKGQLPPPSPASRRLFMRSVVKDDDDEANSSINPNTNKLSLAASFDSAANNNDISGDWSEATSIRSLTNERIRMTHVPSHVNMSLTTTMNNKLNDLEEEEDDTVVMEEDDDDDFVDGGSEKLNEKESAAESSTSLLGTRLNFGSSPTQPGEQPSSSETSSDKKKNSRNESSLESSLYPHTPRGILLSTSAMAGADQQFHNLEMSPIVRLPEDDEDHVMVDHHGEDVDVCSIPMKGSLDSDEQSLPEVEKRGGDLLRDSDDGPAEAGSIQPLFRHVASPILPNKSSEGLLLHQSNESANTPAVDTSGNSSSTMFSSSTVNINNTSTLLNNSNISNITIRPTARKIRPMPDTSAFDLGDTLSSQHSLGSKDSSGFHSHKTGGIGSSTISGGGIHENSHRLLCPPTPIRTPAWAHHQSVVDNQPGALKRANSLITTKVLAACPPRILDNLSSLEDSWLENDISGSTMDSTVVETGSMNIQNHVLFAPPVGEMDEHQPIDSLLNESNGADDVAAAAPCMFRSLDGPAADEISTSLHLGNNQHHETTASSGVVLKESGMMESFYNPSRNKATSSIIEDTQQISFSDFDNLGILGSGAFADVYKVRLRLKEDGHGDNHSGPRFYAIKRTRRQFRGVKDRERAMAEVHTMRRLQSALLNEAADSHGSGGDRARHNHHSNKSNYGLYLLFFIRAWQQDGFFYCQTELCSRATCRHLRLSLSSECWERDVVRYPSLQLCHLEKENVSTIKEGNNEGNNEGNYSGVEEVQQVDRLIPERAIWQLAHDISRGLFHIHSYGMVHYDIKPSNIFFVYNSKWGTICKIGDFGLAGDIGTKDDGQEGDTIYMPNEVLSLSSCPKHPGADIFSLGLTLYELAASPMWSLPQEGDRWHEIRSGVHTPDLPPNRSASLVTLIKAMIRPNVNERPTAEEITEIDEVKRASAMSESFLSCYLNDVESYDSRREREMESAEEDARRRSSTPIAASSSGSFNHHHHHHQTNTLGNSDTVARRRARDVRTPTNDEEDHQPALFR